MKPKTKPKPKPVPRCDGGTGECGPEYGTGKPRTDLIPIVVNVFSLACTDCDAGMGIGSWEEATLKGWRELEEDDGDWWTWLRLCPDCQAEEAQA